jgi:hypothetical protein
MQHDAAEAIALLHGRDSSGRYDDVIEVFARLGHKAKRLVEVVTCRQEDDIVKDRSAAGVRDTPPRPTTATPGRGTTVHLPCTPVADTAGPSTYQQASMSTPYGPFLSGVPDTGFQPTGYLGFNHVPAPACGSRSTL